MKKITKKFSIPGEGLVALDISKKACHPFGFYHGDLVETDTGLAVVAGVYDNKLWFVWEDDTRATYWEEDYKKEDFERDGFKLIKRASDIKEG